ncbi:MAG TPA: hypothetical protein VGN27_08455 [Gaiellaceae bacterium]|jgi:hypothetical protein|nr:hypothetical protein [Gaiellaceae bacterium]
MKAVSALLLTAAALAAFAIAPVARADGDPASDYLLTQQVYLPYDTKLPSAELQKVTATVAAANAAGYRIRVAVIWSSYDLGSVTSLWRQPRTYARFLGAELGYVYKQRLLVVMPNGFGFNRPHHQARAEYALLAGIPVRPGAAGLVDAADAAVRRLASAAGVTLVPAKIASPSARTTHDRIVIVVAALAAIALAVLVRAGLRRRQRR